LYQALLGDAKFHQLLLAFDRDLAATTRAGTCTRCHGVLHSGEYPRKPRGRPAGLGKAYDRRFSFCCARRDCRKRKTPASLRFLGPKVYVGSMVVVISAMRDGATAALQKLSQLVGASRRTIARWRKWWLSVFAASPFWCIAAAAFMPPIDKARLPASLLERFAGGLQEQLIALLRFLRPITGGVAMRTA
jgi:hypothetical protein